MKIKYIFTLGTLSFSLFASHAYINIEAAALASTAKNTNTAGMVPGPIFAKDEITEYFQSHSIKANAHNGKGSESCFKSSEYIFCPGDLTVDALRLKDMLKSEDQNNVVLIPDSTGEKIAYYLFLAPFDLEISIQSDSLIQISMNTETTIETIIEEFSANYSTTTLGEHLNISLPPGISLLQSKNHSRWYG